MRKNSGFTAFELAVTMAIVVIIAAAALPPYLKWLRGYRLRGAVINMMADLEMAKIGIIRWLPCIFARTAILFLMKTAIRPIPVIQQTGRYTGIGNCRQG